jgi:hypothetical protein
MARQIEASYAGSLIKQERSRSIIVEQANGLRPDEDAVARRQCQLLKLLPAPLLSKIA